ncbi:MAG: ABC transporter ATP-binding protein, partial [Oscillospiraceae bacterium]|nr:ABC transporter ATP-binding protein [Oscillospiraceae bacterium]
MLHFKDIKKDYLTGTMTVNALRGVDLKFRKSEFVAVLGPSGCGKTTMLNILGGLDRYTSGDLIINGKSTVYFSDRDWDVYRNRSVGFVFQNYNLIPHQSVLSNVELALTLSGVSKAERRRRAVDVLERVGLGDQLTKRPNQISGGQMQRVAIARALVNNPEILMADEPTGALDSGTSEQVMEILKEISKEKLIIMVTHNRELAEKYSTRTIRLLDGLVTDDSNPYGGDPEAPAPMPGKRGRDRAKRRNSMSFLTALSLSRNNLLTKKTRTFMTAFAGSIGIIGIALILSLSNGFQLYINRVQEDALSTYPIMIDAQTTDIESIISSLRKIRQNAHDHSLDMVYSNDIMTNMIGSMVSEVRSNNLRDFKRHLEENEARIGGLVNSVMYGYGVRLNVYSPDHSDGVNQINPVAFLQYMQGGGGGGLMGGMGSMPGGGSVIWSEMIDNKALLEAQYDVIAGDWPKGANEVVITVDERNEVTDFALYALGFKDQSELMDMIRAIRAGAEFESSPTSYPYKEILGTSYRLVANTDYYAYEGGKWVDMSKDDAFMGKVIDDALELRIVGILRPKDGTQMASITGVICYTHDLTMYLVDRINSSEIVNDQLDRPNMDVITGKPFATDDADAGPIDEGSLPEEVRQYMNTLTEEEREAFLLDYSELSTSTLDANLRRLGVVDLDSPSRISIYPIDF